MSRAAATSPCLETPRQGRRDRVWYNGSTVEPAGPHMLETLSRAEGSLDAQIPGSRSMSYYFSKILDEPFDDAVRTVTAALHREGFGILTEIDVAATMKKKLDVEYRPYVILGACNPPLAHRALSLEDKIGTMLPCNVVVHVTDAGTEVAAIDPVASMSAIENPDLDEVASTVRERLRRVVEDL